MAFVHRYARASGGVGFEDGLSDATAWSIPDAIANAPDDCCVWVKADAAWIPVAKATVGNSGTVTSNTKIRFKAYYQTVVDLATFVSDMDRGQTYYSGALEDGATAAAAHRILEVDGNNGSFDSKVLELDSAHNTIWENFYFHNFKSDGFPPVYPNIFGIVNTGSVNLVIINCKFDSLYSALYSGTGITGGFIYDCYFGSGMVGSPIQGGGITGMDFACNLFDTGGGQALFNLGFGCSVHDNIFIAGTGLYLALPCRVHCFNNVFYFQPEQSILMNHANCVLYEWNNIYVPRAGASDFAVRRITGTLAYSNYNCVWADDGELTLANAYNGCVTGVNSISADPRFKDKANNDFRLKPESGLWNKGMPTLDGGYSTMGTWERMQTPHKLDLAGL